MLKGKRKRFADEYLVDLNGTRAYKAAGYRAKNDNVAHASAAKLLRNATVKAYIGERQKKLADKLEVTVERVVSEYAKLAFADPRLVAEWGPGGVKLKESKEMTDDAAAAVAEVGEVPLKSGGSAMRFKMHDKKGALDSLAKHLGMFVERVDVNVTNGLAEMMAAARRRALQGALVGGEPAPSDD